jgi:hypothetical protein
VRWKNPVLLTTLKVCSMGFFILGGGRNEPPAYHVQNTNGIMPKGKENKNQSVSSIFRKSRENGHKICAD